MNHAHIASVHDVIEQDGADCIVMELVAGESLAAKLARRSAAGEGGDDHRAAGCRGP